MLFEGFDLQMNLLIIINSLILLYSENQKSTKNLYLFWAIMNPFFQHSALLLSYLAE